MVDVWIDLPLLPRDGKHIAGKGNTNKTDDQSNRGSKMTYFIKHCTRIFIEHQIEEGLDGVYRLVINGLIL